MQSHLIAFCLTKFPKSKTRCDSVLQEFLFAFPWTDKDQFISECLFDVLNFPKNQRKIWQISALESKKWSNHKIKAHYNDFDTNYVQIILNIIRRCLYFVDLTTFYILGQKFVKFFVVFLESLRYRKDILKLTDL